MNMDGGPWKLKVNQSQDSREVRLEKSIYVAGPKVWDNLALEF